MVDMKQFIQAHPPRCIAFFSAEVVSPELDDSVETSVTCRLTCQCGNALGEVMGHTWRNPDTGIVLFACPLSIRCPSCASVTEIFDIAQHGYDAELGHGAFGARGEGEPESFICERCQCRDMELSVHLEYSDDLFDEEFVEARGKEQDLFTGFSIAGKCRNCRQQINISDYECA